MSLYTEDEIKAEILADKEHILSQRYPEDLAHEYADNAVPLYYTEIIEEWRDLGGDYQNCYTEITTELPDRIEDLMRTDLYLYYHSLYSGAIQELLDSQEAN